MLIGRDECPSSPEFHRKRGVLSIVRGRILRVWEWYSRDSLPRTDLRASGEDCPTLPLDGFHRKRGVRVRHPRLQRSARGTGIRSIERPRHYYRDLSPAWVRSGGSIAIHRCCPRPRPSRSIQPSVTFTGNPVCVS